MKLKKIASLALAGVMAVSMLAGCSTTETKPNQPTDPTEPVTTNISTEVGALLDAPEYVTFAADSKLDAALETAVEYAGVTDVLSQYVYDKDLQDVADDIYDALGIETDEWATIKNIGSKKALYIAEKNADDGYTADQAVTTKVWAISSTIGQTALENKIADELADVKDYIYAVGGDFNYTYEVSVSTSSKTVNSTGIGSVVGGSQWGTGVVVGGSVSAENPSVTFVAVQVVRTATRR